MKKQKARNSGYSNKTLITPFNVLDFGDPEKDPCFGKLYDLTSDECLACGDIEICSIMFNQRLQQKRIQEERGGSRYDLDLASKQTKFDIRLEYKALVKSGLNRVKARKKLANKYSFRLSDVKEIINTKENKNGQ